MKAIIFGINGQDGYYLRVLLKSKNIEVIGVSRSMGDWLRGDVSDFSFVDSLIKQNQPEYIFHLAANSSTRHSVLFDNHQAISTGTLNILESVKNHCPLAKVFLSGSAMQFKNNGLPIDENTPFEASSPYSVARIHSVYAGRYYREKWGLKIYVGYFFNHDSPLRTESHINQYIISTIKKISQGHAETLEIGNINVKKEFNFAADMMDAIWILVNQDVVFEAVVGGGEAHSIKEWVDYCFKNFHMDWKDFVIEKENFHSEYDILVSNPRIIKEIGWAPKVSFFELADLMIKKNDCSL